MFHPYIKSASRQRWSEAIGSLSKPREDFGPAKNFVIGPDDAIISLGSCFAQHIAGCLKNLGLNYIQKFESVSQFDREKQIYSANYGNIYTAKQLRQLLESAIKYKNGEDFSKLFLPDTKGDFIVDMLRPYAVGCSEFATEKEGLAARKEHLKNIDEILSETDLITITLGLTECWVHKPTRLALPLAPGVMGGIYDPKLYEFVNYTYNEVYEDLYHSLNILRQFKKSMRFLFTISPVSLAATYEKEDVFIATTYSKSVLRAVVGEIVKLEPEAFYFPSYEVINHPLLRHMTFTEDMRNISSFGVKVAMKYFQKNFMATDVLKNPIREKLTPVENKPNTIRCDEEMLEKISF